MERHRSGAEFSDIEPEDFQDFLLRSSLKSLESCQT